MFPMCFLGIMQEIGMKQASVSLIFFMICGILRVFAHSSSSSEELLVEDRLQAESNIRSLDSLVARLMECRKIPGLVLTVVDQKKNVLRREYGYSNIRNSVPMTQHTRHCIASCTKAFTSILLGKMLQNTRHSWDTPVSRILPDYCHFSDQYLTEHVTIRDILSHRTGIDRNYDAVWYSGIFNRTELFKRIRMMPTGNNFRSTATYNNIVYSLAGSITETIGQEGGLRRKEGGGGGGGRGGRGGGGGGGGELGRGGGGKISWEDELRMRLLVPLEMFNTSFYHRRDEPEHFATPYDLARGRIDELEPEPGFNRGVEAIASSIAVCTTSSDISLWMRCLLSALISDDCKVVAQEIVKRVTEEQVLAGDMFHSYIQRPRAPVSLIVDAYGMGWFTGYYRDRRLVMHYGSLPGAYSLLALVPDLQLGIFLTYNGAIQNDPYTINALLLTHLLDTALGLPSWISDFEKDACNFPNNAHFRFRAPAPPHPNVSDFARTRHQVHAYVGVYEHPVLGKVKVRYDQRRLRLSYGLIDSDLLPQNTSLRDDVEDFLGIPRRSGWVQMIDRFLVRFSRLDADHKTPLFRHATVPFLNDGNDFMNDGVDSTFTRVHQGHDLHMETSSFSAPSSSAKRLKCPTRWHPFVPLLLLLLLLQMPSS